MQSPISEKAVGAMKWFFFRDLTGNWCWEYGKDGELVRQSSSRFATRKECISDASDHGYSLIFSRRASKCCTSGNAAQRPVAR
jgi:hypothetical protein